MGVVRRHRIQSVILQRTYNRGVQAADMSIAMPFNFTRLIWRRCLDGSCLVNCPTSGLVGGTIIFAASIWLTRLGGTGR